MPLNPFDTGAELHARVSEILLKIKFARILTDNELADLAYATGVQIAPENKPRKPLDQIENEAKKRGWRV
jgi:hypothetical protein